MKKIFNTIFKTKIRMGIVFFACIGIAVAFTFGPHYKLLRITGASMEPTIDHGDYIVVHRDSAGASVGTIVAVRDGNKGELLTKRIIAGPGDTVEVLYGIIYVNDKVSNSYGWGNVSFFCQECQAQENLSHAKIKIPDGFIWVIGDNRSYSWYGMVPRKNVEGILAWPK